MFNDYTTKYERMKRMNPTQKAVAIGTFILWLFVIYLAVNPPVW